MFAVVAKAIGHRLQHGEGFSISLFLRCVGAARGKRHLDMMAGSFSGCLHASIACQHNQVGQGHVFAVCLRAIEAGGYAFQHGQHLGQLGRLVGLPVFLRRKANTGTVRAAALVACAEARGRSPCRGYQFAHAQAAGKHPGLEVDHVLSVNQRVLGGRDRVLPDQVFGRHLRAQVQALGAHVAVGQLEPGAGVGIGKLIGVGQEVARDFFVGRIELEREIGRGHRGRVLLARVVRVGDHVLGRHVFGTPLDGTGSRGHLLVVVLEQHLEIAHVPLGRVGLPSAFEAAGGGVATLAATVLVDPAEAHFFHGRAFGLGADQLRGTGAVHLAEGVATGHQGHGFVVVHGHACKGLAYVLARSHRVRLAVRPLWVHVDQAHLHCGQRGFQQAVAAVAAVGLVAGGEPFFFGTPIDVFLGGPGVGPAATETEGLEAHGFHGHVARQDEQVSPGDGVAVLLLDRPEQAARLVQVAVVGPAVERCEALVAGACAASAVSRAVGAGSVPGHADEQAAVVAPVGRPPVLALGHQVGQILLHGRVVELLEGFAVVEIRVHGVGHRLVLVQDGQVQLIGPPVCVGLGAVRGARAASSVEGALGFLGHQDLLG